MPIPQALGSQARQAGVVLECQHLSQPRQSRAKPRGCPVHGPIWSPRPQGSTTVSLQRTALLLQGPPRGTRQSGTSGNPHLTEHHTPHNSLTAQTPLSPNWESCQAFCFNPQPQTQDMHSIPRSWINIPASGPDSKRAPCCCPSLHTPGRQVSLRPRQDGRSR